MNDSALQRSLESLEQKYIHLIGSAQKHLCCLEDQAAELKFKAVSREAAMNQLQDKYEKLTNLHATLKEEADSLKSQNVALKEEFDCLKSQTANQFNDVQEENELQLLQLHQVQEELEHYFLENQRILQDGQRKDDKLNWLRGQRELLLRMVHQQVRLQQRFIALDGRTASPSILRRLAPWWQRLQLS